MHIKVSKPGPSTLYWIQLLKNTVGQEIMVILPLIDVVLSLTTVVIMKGFVVVVCLFISLLLCVLKPKVVILTWNAIRFCQGTFVNI